MTETEAFECGAYAKLIGNDCDVGLEFTENDCSAYDDPKLIEAWLAGFRVQYSAHSVNVIYSRKVCDDSTKREETFY